MADCTVLILTYKGKHHLEDLLPSVKKAIDHSTNYIIDVLIVDNGRDNETRDYVYKHFPNYRYEFSPVNEYLFSLNIFIKQIQTNFFFLLNDDTSIDKDIFNQSIYLLEEDKNLFAVSAKLLNWDGRGVQNSIRSLRYTKGWMHNYWDFSVDDDKIRYTFYASGGAALYRTDKFNELGGFDRRLIPFYNEETDLSHRAWHHGWKIVFNPKCEIFHKDAATISTQFKSKHIAIVFYRNYFTWMLKNVDYPGFRLLFFLLLPYRLVRWMLMDRIKIIAFLKSISKLKLGFLFNKKNKMNDPEIMELLGKEYIV